MKRSYTIALVLFFATGLSATIAHAQTDFASPMVERIEEEGYTVSRIKRTLLGRLLIVSTNDKGVRETVLDRRTGAVLRDRVFPDPDARSSASRDNPSPNAAHGANGGGGTGAGGGNGGDGGNGKD